MNDLKPCPFCGGEAHIVHNAKRKSTRIEGVVLGCCVYCVNCTAELFYTSEYMAIEAWNRRVNYA